MKDASSRFAHIPWRWVTYSLLIVVVLLWLLGWILSKEPEQFSVQQAVEQQAQQLKLEPVKGFATTTAVIRVTNTLTDKRGGYMSNDILPPTSLLDNIPAWEFGVIQMTLSLIHI